MVESLRYAVLGQVVPGPTYGYRVAEELRRWPLPASLAPKERGIYRALDWLIGQGLIEPRDATPAELDRVAVADGTTGTAMAATRRVVLIRRIVEATPTGEQQFAAWMRSPLISEDDLFWRIGAARADDLPILVEVLDEAERTWFSRYRDQRVLDVESFGARGAPWSTTKLALLATANAGQISAHSTVLREVRKLLTGLQRRAEGEV